MVFELMDYTLLITLVLVLVVILFGGFGLVCDFVLLLAIWVLLVALTLECWLWVMVSGTWV